MARLMEVAHTAHLVRSRTKTVTRRAGWRMLKAGDQLTLCPRVRGRRPGEALERIVTVDVVAVTRERLGAITAATSLPKDSRSGPPSSSWNSSASPTRVSLLTTRSPGSSGAIRGFAAAVGAPRARPATR